MNDGYPTKSPRTRASALAQLTGAATLAIGALLYGNGSSQLQTLAPGAAGTVLVSQGAAAPAWVNIYAQANTWTAAQTFTVTPSIYSAAGNQQALNIGVSNTQRWAWVRDTSNAFLLFRDMSAVSGPTATALTVSINGEFGFGVGPAAGNGLLQVGAALAADTANFQAYFHNRLALFTRMSPGAYNPAVPSGATGLLAVGQGIDLNTLVLGTHSTAANALILTANGTGIGVTPTAGNGLLQFASGTTRANGVAFGADAFIYRVAANQIDIAGAAGADIVFNVRRSTGENIILQGGSGVCQVGSASNHGVNIITNGAARIVIGSAGQLHMFGGMPVTRPTYGAPTGTATRTTFDTATVTLPGLAERVKAMIDDNRARGDYA